MKKIANKHFFPDGESTPEDKTPPIKPVVVKDEDKTPEIDYKEKYEKLQSEMKLINENKEFLSLKSKVKSVKDSNLNKNFVDYFVKENKDKIAKLDGEELETFIKQERDNKKSTNYKFFNNIEVKTSSLLKFKGDKGKSGEVEYLGNSSIRKQYSSK